MASAHPLPGMSLSDIRPEAAQEWHPIKNAPLTPFDIKPASAAFVWWQSQAGELPKAKR